MVSLSLSLSLSLQVAFEKQKMDPLGLTEAEAQNLGLRLTTASMRSWCGDPRLRLKARHNQKKARSPAPSKMCALSTTKTSRHKGSNKRGQTKGVRHKGPPIPKPKGTDKQFVTSRAIHNPPPLSFNFPPPPKEKHAYTSPFCAKKQRRLTRRTSLWLP